MECAACQVRHSRTRCCCGRCSTDVEGWVSHFADSTATTRLDDGGQPEEATYVATKAHDSDEFMEQKKEPVLHRATEEPALPMSLYKFASLEDEVRAYIAINIEHF
ncbi:hypothetical protein RI054_37g140790 [Pseudoscourfieldia marina]